MRRYSFVCGMILLIGGVTAAPALGQFRGGRRSGRRGGPREMAPERRQEMYDHVAERHLAHCTEFYELTTDQQEAVRARLDELKVEQQKYAEPIREEMRELRYEMIELYRNRQDDGEEVDEARRTEIRDRMRAIWEGSPLMNSDRAAKAIESLLPPEQVAKGRQRRAEHDREREQRSEQWRQRRGERGRDGDRDGREGSRRSRRGDPWDRHVQEFTERYQLDSAQQQTAQSILRELKQERDAYRELHREEFEAVRQIEDNRKRWDAAGKLNEPLDQLYEQLQARLMKTPTVAQLKMVEQSSPTSRPAGPSSRPSADRAGRRGDSRRGG